MATFNCGAKLPQLRVVYEYEYTKDSINSIKEKDLLYSEISEQGSLCFSYYTYYTDSLRSTPNGKKIWRELFTAALSKDGKSTTAFPHRRSTFIISKKFLSDTISIKDVIDNEIYEYKTPKNDFNWIICDSTKTINGYNSYKATCHYHGRDWIAWFTPDIPINDGPWTLCGLPGLILEANDTNNLYSFRFVELNTNNNIIHDWMGSGKKTERLDFLKKKNKYLKRINTISNLEIETKPSPRNDTRYLEGLEIDYKHIKVSDLR